MLRSALRVLAIVCAIGVSPAVSGQTDPAGPGSGSYKQFRGGCWDYKLETARSAFREDYYPQLRSYYIGFRLARSQ